MRVSFNFTLRLCMYVNAFKLYFFIHLHSFDGAKERSKKTPAASKNLRILLLKQKIRTRPAASNKNFHGTRFA